MSAVKSVTHSIRASSSKESTLNWSQISVYLAVAVGVFLLGLIPMWLKARENADQRDAAQRELRLSRMENTLASAVIDARRGEYETARQTTSDFFTGLRQQLDASTDASDFTETQRTSLRKLLTERDNIITLLARSDPAVADRLSQMYVSYRQAMSKVEPKG